MNYVIYVLGNLIENELMTYTCFRTYTVLVLYLYF